MSTLDSLDLNSFITNAVIEVFDTMLSLEAEQYNGDLDGLLNGNKIVGSVSFAGDVMGSINFYVSNEFAQILTGAMLGMEVDEIEDDEEVLDVIGELSNMVGGDLKSKLCDAGFPCELSIPSITSGDNFKIGIRNFLRFERFTYQCQESIIMVEVSIKSAC
ncbi:MAG: chemotaxis protein CheX [Deltaproteobacteria bacterium]|nr:chemotaxis protein CheX [Deltaproteobacteria bacterium]